MTVGYNLLLMLKYQETITCGPQNGLLLQIFAASNCGLISTIRKQQ